MTISSTLTHMRSRSSLPTVFLDTAATFRIAIAAAAARSASGVDVRMLMLTSNIDCYVKFGDSAVVAVNTGINSAFLPADVPIVLDFIPNEYISVIDVAGGPGGFLNICAVY